MIGHEVRLSQTNSYGWVPLCECGWIGDVVPHVAALKHETKRSERVRTLTQARAVVQHDAHLHDVRADIAHRSDAALDAHAKLTTLANATLQRRGRWGNG